jgi:hypothetical protein
MPAAAEAAPRSCCRPPPPPPSSDETVGAPPAEAAEPGAPPSVGAGAEEEEETEGAGAGPKGRLCRSERTGARRGKSVAGVMPGPAGSRGRGFRVQVSTGRPQERMANDTFMDAGHADPPGRVQSCSHPVPHTLRSRTRAGSWDAHTGAARPGGVASAAVSQMVDTHWMDKHRWMDTHSQVHACMQRGRSHGRTPTRALGLTLGQRVEQQACRGAAR